MPILEDIKANIFHECPYMTENVNMCTAKVGVILAASATIGFLCGVGLKTTTTKICKAVKKSKQ